MNSIGGMKKLPQFQYQMDQDNNRPPLQQFKNFTRYLPDRYQGSYASNAQFPNGMPYNYMLHSLNQFYCPGYSYMPAQYPGGNYASGMPTNWRDFQYGHNTMGANSGLPGNYPYPQVPRVASRNTKENDVQQVINLDSDEDAVPEHVAPTKNPVMPMKFSEKPAVIEIEDDSNQRNAENAVKSIQQQKPESQDKKNKKPQVISKLLLDEYKRKAKPQDLKTKPIRKTKRNQIRQHLKHDKILKEKKSSQTYKSKEQKKAEQLQKKKIEKSSKQITSQSTAENQKKKNENLEKIPYKLPQKQTQKQQTRRQISKYIQSHGQIRHGKQFQSKIPEMKVLSSIDFKKWLQQKRNRILTRQIGALTF